MILFVEMSLTLMNMLATSEITITYLGKNNKAEDSCLLPFLHL